MSMGKRKKDIDVVGEIITTIETYPRIRQGRWLLAQKSNHSRRWRTWWMPEGRKP